MASWISNYTELERRKIRAIVVKQLNGETLTTEETDLITRWNTDKTANAVDFSAIESGKIADMNARKAQNDAMVSIYTNSLSNQANMQHDRYMASLEVG